MLTPAAELLHLSCCSYKVTGKEAGVYSHPAPKVTYQAGPEADDTQVGVGAGRGVRSGRRSWQRVHE